MWRIEVARSAGPFGGPQVEDLGVTADGGKRGAQLVGGVGQEAAQPVLGGGPGSERRFDVAKHGVEGQTEPADLGPVLGRGDPATELASGDLACGRRHVLERPEVAAHDPPRQPAQAGHDDQAHQQFHPQQPTQGVGHVAQRDSDDDREVVLVTEGPHHHPVTERTVILAGYVEGLAVLVGQELGRHQQRGRWGGAAVDDRHRLSDPDPLGPDQLAEGPRRLEPRRITGVAGERSSRERAGERGVTGRGGAGRNLGDRPRTGHEVETRTEAVLRVQGPGHRERGHLQLGVDTGQEERAELGVRHHVGDDQTRGDDTDEDQQETGPQRHGWSGGRRSR